MEMGITERGRKEREREEKGWMPRRAARGTKVSPAAKEEEKMEGGTRTEREGEGERAQKREREKAQRKGGTPLA